MACWCPFFLAALVFAVAGASGDARLWSLSEPRGEGMAEAGVRLEDGPLRSLPGSQDRSDGVGVTTLMGIFSRL